METVITKSDDEFEPDNNFFDSFLDGMDALIDNSDKSWISGKAADEDSDTSSGCDRMVIDLPSSPENHDRKEKNSERCDNIKDILTNRVLEQLEKNPTHRSNTLSNSFPSNHLVDDVLNRLKKSIQQKNESPSCSFSEADKNKTLQMKIPGREESDVEASASKTLFESICEKDGNSNVGYSEKRKKRKHRKHKSCKRHRRHKKKSKRGGNSEPSLESVSSDDDILNFAENPTEEPLKQPDCEEGEVLSSSSDWESERLVKRRRPDFEQRLTSPGSWSHWCEREPCPPWACHEGFQERERFLHRAYSPSRFYQSHPWSNPLIERSRVRIPVPPPPPPPPPPHMSPVALRLRAGSPSERKLASIFIDDFGRPVELLPKRIEHQSVSVHRRNPCEASRHVLKRYSPIDSPLSREAIPYPPAFRIERRYPEMGISERREKTQIILRCLQEIRHQAHKSGRFIFNPKFKGELKELGSAISRFSSPLYICKSQSPCLKFTSPFVRHVGTSSSSLRKSSSVGCQTVEIKSMKISDEDQERKSYRHSQLTNVGEESFLISLQDPQAKTTNTVPSKMVKIIEKRGDAVADVAERKRSNQKIVPREPSVTKPQDLSFFQRTQDIWKSIVAFRYPDLSEKERDQVVLVKSMEVGRQTGQKNNSLDVLK